MTRANRLLSVTVTSKPASAADAQEQALAIHDLIETANFALANGKQGPYKLHFGLREERLELAVNDAGGHLLHGFALSMKPFARVIRDYHQIKDNYVTAINGASPHAIEAVDMARRAIHNEAAELLQARLAGKVDMDHDTARRLFTLICSLNAEAAPALVTAKPALPRMVLFVCTQNAIRSPMAAAITHHFFGQKIYSASAGLQAGDPDPFVGVVMDELDIDLKSHRPHSLRTDEDLAFDLIITLSAEAQREAHRLPLANGAMVESWLMPDPSATQGTRDQILDAYRALRDDLVAKIQARFG